ncbi:MAG: hypothetical protein R2834_02260 [Rhodothermales bacterium]
MNERTRRIAKIVYTLSMPALHQGPAVFEPEDNAMIHYRFCANKPPLLTCDACERPIEEETAVLLRSHCALPEEATYHVHPECLASFEGTHPGEWDVIDLHSLEAGWLI